MAREKQLRHIRLLTEDPVDTSRVLKEGQALYEESSGKLFVGDDTRTIAQLDTACEFFSKQGYKEYVALLSDPADVLSVTVLKNEIGDIVWEEGGTGGEHTGTLTGAFPSGRTIVFCGGAKLIDEAPVSINASRVDANIVTVTSYHDGAITGGFLDQTAVIIRVYPA